MLKPSIEELTQNGRFNRYELVIATAKCARIVTDEYVKQREVAEKMIANKETDKTLVSMIKREFRDEKAVMNAVNRLNNGEFRILRAGEQHTGKSLEETIAAEAKIPDDLYSSRADDDYAADIDRDENEDEDGDESESESESDDKTGGDASDEDGKNLK